EFPPKWLEQEANKTAEQVKNLKTSKTLAFILLADNHLVENGTWKHTAEAISQLCKRTEINAIIHLGDFTDGMAPKQKTIEYANIILNDLKQNKMPVHAAIGNHDYNCFNKNPEIFTRHELSELYLNKNELNYSVNFPEQNLRFIFLDSYDNNNALRYGFSMETLNFLSNELENSHKAMIFSHLPPMAVLQAWAKEIRGESEIMEILNANSKKIIAFLNGHNHCDLLYNGNFPIISINNAKCEYFLEHKPQNAHVPFRKLGEAIQESFDIMLVEPQQSVVNFIRFGAGQNRQIKNGIAQWSEDYANLGS
ncbi:MAG: metallophosphoesterase, partial [Fibromonadales bacterium]|nr:metallophosphoesterase [Fibromonadales bacterium]